jgi:hypothetical protein
LNLEIWKCFHQIQMKNSLNWRKCYFLWPDNSRRDNSHQWIWAICSINSLVQDEIGSIFYVTIWQKFVAGRIPGETYLLQGIRETKLIITPLKGSWFSERKCQLISH